MSKNDSKKVEAVWEKVWNGLLELEDFAIRSISWGEKRYGVAEVMKLANIRSENTLFIDDNPVERAAVLAEFPQIRVLGWEPFAFRRILLASPETQVTGITNESSRRSEMIRAQVIRDEARGRMSRAEFLHSLQVEIAMDIVRSIDDPHFERCFELVNKTNQFNTTGARWTVQQFQESFSTGMISYAFSVKDKYVDYGLVIVVILKNYLIEQFAMSCRVIGLEAERAAITQVLQIAKTSGTKQIVANLTPTAANQVCQDFYQRCGFRRSGALWVFDIEGSDIEQRGRNDGQFSEATEIAK